MAQGKLITTPRGTFLYPHLVKADSYQGGPRNYKVRLRLASAPGMALLAQLTALRDTYFDEQKAAEKDKGKAAKMQMAPLPIQPVFDSEGKQTGEFDVSFKSPEFIKLKSGEQIDMKPVILDAKRKPTDATFGGGSEGKISFSIFYWNIPLKGVGLSLRPRAAQLLMIATAQGGTFGFDDEEGFEGSPDDAPEASGIEQGSAEADGNSLL